LYILYSIYHSLEMFLRRLRSSSKLIFNNKSFLTLSKNASTSSLIAFAKHQQRRSSSNAAYSLSVVFVFLMSLSCSHAESITEEKTNDNLPIYTMKEVSEHISKDKGIWVTYKGNIYDITKFVANHPGGKDKILMAAGKDIEPFWNLYRQHYNSKLPMELLSAMIVGRLHPDDILEQQQKAAQNDNKQAGNPYKDDPVLPAVMKVYNQTPINAEAPRVLETDNWITPTELWFVRNHHPVPIIENIDNYKLAFRLEKPAHHNSNSTPPNTPPDRSKKTHLTLQEFTLPQLQGKFTEHSVVSSVQCGGNRRSEMNSVAFTNGIAWEISAISTAKWTGVKLRDVLHSIGVTNDKVEPGHAYDWVKHVHFVAMDGMEASVPIRKALDRYGDVLLAYGMNDEILAQKHGFPLRVIIPGHAGVRNVKWIKEIRLSDEEAYGPWQRGMAYKGFGPSLKSLEDVDVEKIPSLQEQPVQSAICYPLPNELIPANDILTVKGYAYSGGGRGIVRVDVSIDEGKTWHTANLLEGKEQPLDHAWAWTFWDCDFPITSDLVGNKLEVICKATDASYNVQPDSIKGIWNLRGINNNAWHRINVTVVPEAVEDDTD